jgi:hypothetical protein
MWIFLAPHVRNAQFAGEKSAPCVDAVHEIVGLHGQFQSAGEVDRRGVVYQDVDSAETLKGLGNGRFDGGFETDVAFYSQGFPLWRSLREGLEANFAILGDFGRLYEIFRVLMRFLGILWNFNGL